MRTTSEEDELDAITKEFPVSQNDSSRRPRRRWILRYVPKHSVGCEIGVFRGHFTELILEHVQPRQLFLVDPWTRLGETFGWGQEYTNFDTLKTATAKREVELRARAFPETDVRLIEGTYPDCRQDMAPVLDWAYLDASHSFEATLNELVHLDSHVSETGLILGDDWVHRRKGRHHGVFQAVQRFVRDYNWEIIAAGYGLQWCIRRRR